MQIEDKASKDRENAWSWKKSPTDARKQNRLELFLNVTIRQIIYKNTQDITGTGHKATGKTKHKNYVFKTEKSIPFKWYIVIPRLCSTLPEYTHINNAAHELTTLAGSRSVWNVQTGENLESSSLNFRYIIEKNETAWFYNGYYFWEQSIAYCCHVSQLPDFHRLIRYNLVFEPTPGFLETE